jgi:SDR family mycofactocin-dependent oxidoreductase
LSAKARRDDVLSVRNAEDGGEFVTDLSGQVAFVTGAARGLGRAVAVRLAEHGADLVLVDICANIGSVPYPLARRADLEETVALAEQAGARVRWSQTDVRDSIALQAAVAEADRVFGRLDIVVACAGIASLVPFDELTDSVWDDSIEVNLGGAFRTAKATLPLIRRGARGGSIVFVSSTAAVNATRNLAHYCAAKHGLTGLMQVIAREFAAEGIRVNAVLPTSMNTAMIHNEATYARILPDADAAEVTPEQTIPVFTSLNLLPVPWVEPDDVANAILWLVGDQAAMITGVQLPVDAGKTVP